MKIAYYMPFKPMGHPIPSGDLTIGSEIFEALKASGAHPELISSLRLRWVYYRPDLLLRLLLERIRVVQKLRKSTPNLWLSYHCYYKAPDLLGAHCAAKLHIPYVIFQGIYSTKRRKKLLTYPGFLLNKKVLESADHIFTNKIGDLTNLARIISKEKLTYIAPGLHPDSFTFSEEDRLNLRRQWIAENETVIMTAAMMRPGVKTEGILRVVASCAKLLSNGSRIKLIIAGDGQSYNFVKDKTQEQLGDAAIFLGRIKREKMYRYYSAADIFAFPGIQEALGMVYLEAQSCGLPVVAYEDWGGKEAILHEKTGLLSAAQYPETFTLNLKKLVDDPALRKKLGENGQSHIRKNHDLQKNYRLLAETLQAIAEKTKPKTAVPIKG